MTTSEPWRASFTAWTIRGTFFADARPPLPSVAVHAWIRLSSITCVAPTMASLLPFTVTRYGL